ncbi:hypothetical protein [Kitasatospora sp. NPDC094011]|uniref:hypothetical protein n=1 Tax=Kitasatospora sp. NPDC094011 TaxID=3364090 RepID=UPI0037F9059B
MRVILTRDDVHPGDCPTHVWDYEVDGATTLGELIDQAVDYPLRMDRTDWSVALEGTPANEAPIAMVSRHWVTAHFTDEADRRLRLDSVSTAPGELRLHFRPKPSAVPVEPDPVWLFPFSLLERLFVALLESLPRRR